MQDQFDARQQFAKARVKETVRVRDYTDLDRFPSRALPVALFGDDSLGQLFALLAARMVDEAVGNARVAAARAGFHVESQE